MDGTALTLTFLRVGARQRPVLAVGEDRLVVAEYRRVAGWMLTRDGAKMGLTQRDLDGVAGPGDLQEGEAALEVVMRK